MQARFSPYSLDAENNVLDQSLSSSPLARLFDICPTLDEQHPAHPSLWDPLRHSADSPSAFYPSHTYMVPDAWSHIEVTGLPISTPTTQHKQDRPTAPITVSDPVSANRFSGNHAPSDSGYATESAVAGLTGRFFPEYAANAYSTHEQTENHLAKLSHTRESISQSFDTFTEPRPKRKRLQSKPVKQTCNYEGCDWEGNFQSEKRYVINGLLF